MVHSNEEVLKKFEKADYTDCSINLYPCLEEGQTFLTPDILFIDQDDRLQKDFVLARIEQIWFGKKPTILDSGWGLAIMIPIDGSEFTSFSLKDIKKTLHFLEREVSWGEADPGHYSAFNSCMIRVPGTINSKNGNKVHILQRWDGVDICSILHSSLRKPLFDYLTEVRPKKHSQVSQNHVNWIDNLLLETISDGRGCAIERIFCPYLIRRMPKNEALFVLKRWLDKCIALRPLTNPSKRYTGYIEYYLDYALRNRRRFSYLREETLKAEHPELYDYVMKHCMGGKKLLIGD